MIPPSRHTGEAGGAVGAAPCKPVALTPELRRLVAVIRRDARRRTAEALALPALPPEVIETFRRYGVVLVDDTCSRPATVVFFRRAPGVAAGEASAPAYSPDCLEEGCSRKSV